MDEHVLPNEKSFVDDHLDYEHYEKCFIGSYSHSLDGKGRLVVPQSFREELGKTFYIAPSKDFSYAALYPSASWARVRDGFARLGSMNAELNMFLNQFLSMTGDEIKAGRILLFGIRDTDGGQTFGSRLRGSTFMTSLEYADNSGIRNRMIIKTDRIPEAMDEVLSDKRFQFEIYHEIAHIHWFWVQR